MTHYCFFREGTKYKTMLLQDFYKTRYFYNFLSDHIFLLLIMVEMKQQTSVVWIIWLQVCNKKLAYIKSINQHNWSTVNWKWKNQNNCCRGFKKKILKSHYQLWMILQMWYSYPCSAMPSMNSCFENTHCVAALNFQAISRTLILAGSKPRSSQNSWIPSMPILLSSWGSVHRIYS